MKILKFLKYLKILKHDFFNHVTKPVCIPKQMQSAQKHCTSLIKSIHSLSQKKLYLYHAPIEKKSCIILQDLLRGLLIEKFKY